MTEQNKTTTIPLPVQGKDMDSIMQSLESGVEELFTSNRYQEFLKTMAKFHNYSFNNTMLIAMQRPDATLVTSYKNWQSMGRQVMKGEKGITIIAPAPYKKMKEKEVLDENQRPIMGTDGKPKTEQVEVTVPHFKAVTVFDIAQTSGEPIQTLAPELLTAAVQDFDSFMQAIQKISPVPIRFDEIDGNANGYYHNADKEIVIKKGLSESQTLKTAIHETAHAKLHDKEIMEKHDLQMIFYPHRNMQKYLKEFHPKSDRIIIADWRKYDGQGLLKESAFLITDLSSIFMDFGYMRKPMLYFQFDMKKFREGQYQQGYFEYKRDGFGPVCEKLEEVEQELEKAAANQLQNNVEYLRREEAFFPLWDSDNCKRNYEAIKEI